MKKYLAFGIIIISLFAVSCGQYSGEKQRLTKEEKRKLRIEDSLALKIGVMPTLDCLPIYLAKDHNLFDKQGVDVHLRDFNAQMDCDTALVGGSVEGSITDLIRVERLAQKGLSLNYAIATNTYWQLISNRLTRVREVRQLSDKMVGMTRFSATDYLSNLFIGVAKPKYDVYRIQINDVDLRLKMLLNNELDAALLPEPQATMARLHANPVLADSRSRDLRLGIIAFRSKALQDKRRQSQLNHFIKAYNMACDSLNRNGFLKYETLLKKYYNLSDKEIKALPKLIFEHAHAPRKRDIDVAKAAEL